MVNKKLIFSLFFSLLLLTVAISAKVADVAYVTKNMNPNAQVTSVFSELNLTYRLIDSSQISNTNFSQYKMIFIGDESFSGIESIPVTNYPSLIMNSYNYYSRLFYDDLGWSASKGQVGSSSINVKIINLNHPIAQGLSETFRVYTGSSTIYYLKGKKATGIDLIAYVLGSAHTSADAVVAAADAGDKFLNGRTTNTRNVFFGMTKAESWTSDTRKMFKNSVLWVLRGSDFDHDNYFSDVDCNDENPNIHPGATEIPYNNIDENCDGYDLADVDADGYCKLNYVITNKALQCNKEISNIGSDCNDNNINIHPGATEIINNIDENCVNDAPVLIQTILNYQWQEDNNLSNAFNLSNHFKDPEGDILSYRVINNTHIKVLINNGIVSFSPDKDFFGQETIKFIANDSKLEAQSNPVILTITNVNDAPILQPIPNVNVVEGNVATIIASGTDVDVDNLTYSINDSRFNVNNNIFTWQTSSSSHGTYKFKITVSDGILNDNKDVTINILPKIVINEFSSNNAGNDWIELYNVNTYPINLNDCILKDASSNQLILSGNINSKSFSVFEWSNKLNNDGDTIMLLCNNLLIDQVIYGSGNAPVPGLDESTGRKSDGYDTDNYANDFIIYHFPTRSLSNLADMIKPVVTLISPNNELLNVDHVNFTYSASDNNVSILNCSLYSDIYGNFKLIQNKNVNNPSTGSFFIDNINDGNYIWNVKCRDTLNEAFAASNYSFTIDEPDKPVINSWNISTQSFSSSSLSLTLSENKTYKFEINVSDADNNIKSTNWYLDNNVASNETIFNYATGFNSEGSHNITFIVEDTTNLRDSKIWSIIINNINRNPILEIENQTINEDEQKTFKINVSDPDNDALSLSVIQKDVNKVNCVINDGNLTLIPFLNWNGITTCKIRASDARGGYTEKLFNINVLAVNDAPIISLIQNITVNENNLVTIIVNAHDVDSTNLTYSINDSRFNVNNNIFTWQTNYDDVGTYNFVVSVSDGLLTAQQKVKVIVVEVDKPPVIDPIDNVTINEDSGYNEYPDLLNAVDADGTIEEFRIIQEDTNKVDCIISDKVLAYIPAKDFYGVASCIVEVRDNSGSKDSTKFYINVNPINDAPIIDSFIPIYNPIIKLNGQQLFSITKHDIDNANSDLLTRWFVNGASIFIGDNFNYVNNGVGNFNITAIVSDGKLQASHEWNVVVSEVPFSNKFDLSALEDIKNKNNLGNVHNFTISSNNGKIEFLDVVDLRNVLDMDNNIEISRGLIGVDSNSFTSLANKKARITLHNLSQNEMPQIYYSNIFTKDASQVNNQCTVCSNINYVNHELTFDVSSFSTFRIGNLLTCSQLNGFICNENNQCAGNWLNAFEQRCCSSICQTSTETNETQLDKCKNGKVGNIDLTIKEPHDGDDFKPGDIIDIEVKVDNDYTKDLDIKVKAILFDVTNDEEIESADQDVSINSDESDTVDLKIDVPSDIKGGNDYILFVKAFEDKHQDRNCNEDQKNVEIKREKYDVIIKNIRIIPNSVKCGELVNVNVEVENIGRNDEDNVYITLKNSDLKINEQLDEFKLDKFDNDDRYRKEEFFINIPENTKTKDYTIIAEVFFNDQSYTQTAKLNVGECATQEYVPTFISSESQQILNVKSEQNVVASSGIINDTKTLIFLIVGNIVLLLAIIYVIQLIFRRK